MKVVRAGDSLYSLGVFLDEPSWYDSYHTQQERENPEDQLIKLTDHPLAVNMKFAGWTPNEQLRAWHRGMDRNKGLQLLMTRPHEREWYHIADGVPPTVEKYPTLEHALKGLGKQSMVVETRLSDDKSN